MLLAKEFEIARKQRRKSKRKTRARPASNVARESSRRKKYERRSEVKFIFPEEKLRLKRIGIDFLTLPESEVRILDCQLFLFPLFS